MIVSQELSREIEKTEEDGCLCWIRFEDGLDYGAIMLEIDADIQLITSDGVIEPVTAPVIGDEFSMRMAMG